MLNKLERFIRQHDLIVPGERVICAVSGGADSMALMMGLYLLRDKMGFFLEAAHFNHCLRGQESDDDESFVRDFCQGMQIPFHCGREQVIPGKKGLEAAARDARYGYFAKLDGKIATAHTADDNAETVLMHMVRGTGLKGLGGIAPCRGNIIRPMLNITRAEIIDFLDDYHIRYRTDSSNLEDVFLRNRLRHHVLPLLTQENPRFTENLSAMALRLRLDEEALQKFSNAEEPLTVSELIKKPAAIRYRILEAFLKNHGVREPEAEHLLLSDALLFSDCPSAKVNLPGGMLLYRRYDTILCGKPLAAPESVELSCPGTAEFGEYRLLCKPAKECINSSDCFTVSCRGTLTVRSRCSGDEMRLSGGRKSLKKLYIDRKIPADLRPFIPVLADENGVVGVYGIGADLDHMSNQLPSWQISITKKKGLPEETDDVEQD